MTYSDIRTQLERQGFCAYTVVGASMSPMLRQGQDVVMIRKKTAPPQVGDVVLYDWNGELTLHRIRAVGKQGYRIRGDHSYTDHKNVPEQAVLGILEYYVRDGVKIDCATNKAYLRYVRRRTASYPIRWVIYKLLGKAQM